MNNTDLVDRLAAHKTLAGVPRAQLEWLVSRGQLRRYETGELIAARDGTGIGYLYVVLAGHISISVNRAGRLRKLAEWRTGDVTGFLPYSRLTTPPGDTVIEEPTEVFMVHREHFPAMTRECFELTSVLVHVMLDRARYFRSTELHDEKMSSLGRLAAGLAHELNNPASAVVRSAKSLTSGLAEIDAASRAYAAAGLSDEQVAAVSKLREMTLAPAPHAHAPLELADREDAIAEWLVEHGADSAAAHTLANSAITPAALDALDAALDAPMLPVVIRYLAADHAVRRLASEIEMAASRIYSLVAAVKGFTYLDQSQVPKAVDLKQGLSDTLTVLRAKARAKSVDLRLELEPELPHIQGFGGELNQVWANLIDNALDAAPQAGRVTVSAARDRESVVVRVSDDGAGIPDEIRDRIFDPFFTTKRVGEGTGLGLDIARRIVHRHDGDIDVTSGPGGTHFTVTLPLDGTQQLARVQGRSQ
jgi:signal transduction histidine kinase